MRNEEIRNEVQIEELNQLVKDYQSKGMHHLGRMEKERFPKIAFQYCPKGRRDVGRPRLRWRRLRWAGHAARMGESRNAYRVLVGRPEGKRPLGRPRHRWEDNIKMYLSEVGYDDRDWINLAQDRNRWRAYVRAAMNLRVP
ncbi:hypothetical protein ANN_05126 [Periplaneta americana]|uniref:Uncharacterized protein n=1 Tax=Periplaneta americana TaxID=6978 RepID=A0ABQ8TA75_PERAM|nr:hypothetical protein ANN_05126 [Periplaneta americana]